MGKEMIEPQEAWERIMAEVSPLPPRRFTLDEVAGRVLAEDVRAEADHPPFAASTVDGWAVVAGDDSPRRRILSGDGRAGEMPAVTVVPGTAARVMTGAPLPPGADAVVMVEDSEVEGEFVHLTRAVRPGENVRPAGSDLAARQLILAAGMVLGPAEIGLLATVGRFEVWAYPSPRVAILSTGDEVVEPWESPGPAQIRDSNRYALMAAVREAGGAPLSLGIVPDRPEALREAIEMALDQADVLITSGGVSEGERDHIGPLLAELGTVHFNRVRQKPGKPFTFATVRGQPCFALPGNPVSALVSFELYVRPALRRMAGHTRLRRPEMPVRLRHPLQPDPVRTEFVRAVVEQEGDGWWARTTGAQASSRLLSMLGANALLRVPPGPVLPEGTGVTAILITRPEDH
ncbi:MAG: molybdopterin molybdotransferase MoeA [Thermoflexales bacterium]|nr:molybdopterin molybdotransferase MoeA [Thermoflexales bacterium]